LNPYIADVKKLKKFKSRKVEMNLFRVLGWTATVIGVVLVVVGIVATHETSEKIVEGFTGHYTHTTMWYILGGLALILGGLAISRVKR
jgi:hypothetical protein